MAYYEVGDISGGKTLRQLAPEYHFRSDTLAGFLGIGEDDVLEKGRTFSDVYVPENYRSSSEASALGKIFGAGKSPGQKMIDTQRTEEQAFLDKFKTEYPGIIEGIETDLNLPALRNNAFTSAQLVESAPERQTQATRGFDVNANQLERIIASDVARLSPIAQKAIDHAQFAEGEFGRRAEQELLPFTTELELMKDRFGRETGVLSQEFENEFQLTLNNLNNKAALERAVKLAELEENLLRSRPQQNQQQNLMSINLGNRIALIDPLTGREVSSYGMGLAPTRGGLSTLSEWGYG